MLALVDDERLAALAAGGSEHAFGELVQRHEARLLMVSRSVLRSDDDARDAVQNALLKAFRALQEGQLRGAPRPWLARIAHNEARSLARVRREFAPLDPETLGVSGDPHEAMLAKERLAALVADVAALPERLRRPLLLRADAGLSYDAIALALGTSASAARRAVCDARATLEAEASAREADCADIRTILTGPDRRRHRSRRVRGHLRACVACRAWRPERRPLLLLPGGGLFWNVAQWINSLFTAGSGSVAGAARSTALVVAVSAGSVTLATDRPPREPAKPRKTEAPTPVLVTPSATPETLTLRTTKPPQGTPTATVEPQGGEAAARAGGEVRMAGRPRARRVRSGSGELRGKFRGTRPAGETWPEGESRAGRGVGSAGEMRPADGTWPAGEIRPRGETRAARETRPAGERTAGESRPAGETRPATETRQARETPPAIETRPDGETPTAAETRPAESGAAAGAPAAGGPPAAGEPQTAEAGGAPAPPPTGAGEATPAGGAAAPAGAT